MRNICVPAALLLLTLLSCSSEQRVLADKNSAEGKELLGIVNLFNSSLPDTIKAEMSVKIHAFNKTIKANGILYYRKDLNKWKIILKDPVFNTILFHLLAEGDTVSLYTPIDKTMLVRRIDPTASSFIEFEQNPAVLYILASSRIPLIPDAQVKSLASEKNNSAIRFLVLENSLHTETIRFNEKNISQIFVKEKNGGNRMEINYSDQSVEKGYSYFKKLEANSNDGSSKLFITYNSIKINQPIPDKDIFRINLPSDAKIIR